jgi:ribulose-bisphosphate carboxylase small chain
MQQVSFFKIQEYSLKTAHLWLPAEEYNRICFKGTYMQAYDPASGKKFETLSYLPELSVAEITRIIDYLILHDWTPCLEFSEDGDIYLNTRMGPCYYDNRYWTMYKLPMFGCTDSSQVIREIENCKRDF